ncbi:nSTAND1 domain-containing NTPase [Rhodococcus sp. NPDC003383]
MPHQSTEPLDPERIGARTQFAEALTELRTRAGLSVRDVVAASGAQHGTVAGWFAGQHLPTKASSAALTAVLAACGVDDEAEVAAWQAAAGRARQAAIRRADKSVVPYRGLAPFGEEDAPWFFGRDDLTAELLARVRGASTGAAGRVLFVIGPSGAGKSSLLRAGLAASVAEAFPEWRRTVVTPAGIGVSALVAALTETGPALLVVDQFEELWTHCGPDDRATVLTRLAAVGPDVVVVLGLRADFYPAAAREPVLVPILAAGPLVVGPLTDTDLEKVIVAPAEKAGATVPDELVRVLLADLTPRTTRTATDPGTLPLLSHALLGTWQRARRRTLTVADYLATGGVSGAVQKSAEEVYAELTPEQQVLARRIFLRLVNVDDDTQTRRRTPWSELAIGDTADVTSVVDRFAARRLLTVDEDTVQLSHEVLLTAWDRLREWIDSDRVGLGVHRRLTRAAQVWQDSGRDTGALLTGGRLELFEEWVDDDRRDALNSLELEFVDASLRHRDLTVRDEQRRTRMLRRLVGALAVVSVVAVTAAVAAGLQANGERAQAQSARDEAMSRQIATVSAQLRDDDPALASQLAAAGYQVSDTLEARSALLDATAVHAPTRIAGPEGGSVARVDPDARIVASAGSDGVVRLFPVIGGRPAVTPVAELPATVDGALYALEFGPDGSTLAVGGQGGARLWDVRDPANPRVVTELTDTDRVIYGFAFDPTGTRLAAGDATGHVLRWNIDGAAVTALPELEHPGAGTAFVAFSPDGRTLATLGRQASMRLWDTSGWDTAMTPRFDLPPDGSTVHHLSATFSPDGRTLASGTTRREVARWSLADDAPPVPLPPLTGFSSYVNDVAFDSTGTWVAAGSSDNTVQIWRAADGEPVEMLPGANPVTSVRFSPDGSAILTGALDGVTRWWPLPGPALPGARDTVYVNPIGDGTLLLAGAGGRAGGIPLWDIDDLRRPRPLPELVVEPGVQTGAAAITSDADLAAVGTVSGAVALFDLTEPTAPRSLGSTPPVVAGMVGVVAFDHEGHRMAVSAQDDATVALVDVTDRNAPRTIGTFTAGNYPQMMAFAPDGTLAVPTADGEVELWATAGSSEPTLLSTVGGFDSQAQAVAFTPDGATLAAGSADRSIRLWDVTDRTAPRDRARITGPADAVYSLQFSPSGDRLAAGVGGGAAWLWDVQDAEHPAAYAVLSASGTRVNDATWAHDGEILAGGGPDRLVRLWTTDTEAATDRVCENAGSAITEDEWERYLPGVPYRNPCAGQ